MRRLSQPTCLTNFFVNRPYLWLYIVFLVLGSLSFVVFYLNWFKVNEVNAREYLVWDDVKTENFDKSTLARSMLIAGGDSGEA